ncbi:PAS domain S-box protein [Actinokineospora guangxiensis]|uniref:PAS domain S-box protein n=1 Tax=Actinokineospora guangxiensis TaxID=1490288 RepID=A0ABW0EXM5_9PSEU
MSASSGDWEEFFTALERLGSLVAEVRDEDGRRVWCSADDAEIEVDWTGAVAAAGARVLRGGDAEEVEVSARKRTGGRGWAEVRIFGIDGVGPGRLVGCSVRDVTERRFAEEQVGLLLDRLPVVFTVTDADGWVRAVTRSTLFSPRFEEGGLDQLVPPGHPAREEVMRVFHAALGGEAAAGRYLWQGRWTQGYAVPHWCGDQVVGVLGVAIDVHDLVTAERARTAAEARFRLFMDRSPATAAIRDGRGDYIWVNEAARRAYQVPASVRPPFAAGAAFGSHVAGVMDAMHARLKRTGGSETKVWRIPLERGEVHIFGHRFAFHDAEGRYLEGNIGLDVTERVLANKEAVRWRDRYQVLFDRAPMPMVVLSSTGVVLDANPALCELFAARLSQLRGRAIADFHEPDEATDAAERLAELVSGVSRVVRFTRAYRTRDGSAVTAVVTCVLVPGEDDAPSVVAILRPESTRVEGPRSILLSGNEVAALESKALGLSNDDIGERLRISRRGVDYQLRGIARKFRCANSGALLVATAYHLGVLDSLQWPPRVRVRFRVDVEEGEAPRQSLPFAQ